MGVKVTTGYTATSSKDVTLYYKCSYCGADNRAVQRISGIGQTGLFFGSPTNPDYRQDAQNSLLELIKDLCKQKPSERYVDAEFDCKCCKCGKREPWARLRYDYIKYVWKFIGWTVMFAFAFLAGGVSAVPILIYLAAMLWAAVHKPIHSRIMYKKIDAMPPENLPRITMDLNGREVELRPDPPASAPPKPEPPKSEPPKPKTEPSKPVVDPKAVVRQPASVLLTLTTGPRAGTAFRAVEGNTVIVGRNPSRCNLVLAEYSRVSGQHCRLEVTDTGLTVTDLGSTNGTFVNGTQLQPNRSESVPNGSEIRLGDPECLFRVQYT